MEIPQPEKTYEVEGNILTETSSKQTVRKYTKEELLAQKMITDKLLEEFDK